MKEKMFALMGESPRESSPNFDFQKSKSIGKLASSHGELISSMCAELRRSASYSHVIANHQTEFAEKQFFHLFTFFFQLNFLSSVLKSSSFCLNSFIILFSSVNFSSRTSEDNATTTSMTNAVDSAYSQSNSRSLSR